jgi:endonuclease YncB( thermonuclease family)
LVRDNVVTEKRTIAASADAVAEALNRHPRFGRQMPWWLTIGFPRPVASAADGDTLHIEMRGGEMRLNGMEPRTGTLILRREDTAPNIAVWRALSDDSHMRHFLTWRSSEVRWRAIDERTTEVTWTIRFRRDLDPAWYFGPMERFVVRLAAGYLIDAVATP